MRAGAMVIVCAIGGTAVASPGGDIPLDAFRPAVDSRGFVTVDGAAVLDRGQPSCGLVTTWAKHLLALDGAGAHYSVDDVISPTLVGAVGVGVHLELALSLPLGIMAGDRDPDAGSGVDVQRFAIARQGLGDLALAAKAHLGATGPIAWAAVASVTLPTGTRDAWLSAGRTAVGARLVAETTLGAFRLGANVGVRAPLGGDESFMDMGDGAGSPATGAGISIGPALPIGGAIAWAVAPGAIELVGEGFALVPLRGDGYFPIEALGGARFYLARSSHLELGAGAGLGGAGGNPELRAFLGIVFEPTSPAHASGRAVIVADADPPPPPGDRDGDRIPDNLDACPDDPEDHDGYQDSDGCPDPDNDGDGIADVDDLCANQAEDKDGIQDEDGCPETDADGDKVADLDDHCPLERGPAGNAGCPKYRDVKVGDGVLVVLEDINFEFDSAVLRKDSYEILDHIAETIVLDSGIDLIEVGGHTDDRGADLYNLDLSQRRAEAVVAYLVAKGVASERLAAQGYGERVPKIRAHTEAAWAVNRRVEFVILKRH